MLNCFLLLLLCFLILALICSSVLASVSSSDYILDLGIVSVCVVVPFYSVDIDDGVQK